MMPQGNVDGVRPRISVGHRLRRDIPLAAPHVTPEAMTYVRRSQKSGTHPVDGPKRTIEAGRKPELMDSIRLALKLDDESGVYTVTSPDVPGLVTEGTTPDEINRNVEEALQGLLDVWADLGLNLAPEAIRSIIRQLGLSREEFGPIK